jgi:predicted acetyltransferase
MMPRGDKRAGLGRKAQGISLTLTAEEWAEIEISGAKTIAAFWKRLLNE